MPDYEIRFLPEAVVELKRLDSVVSRRIAARLDWLRSNLDSITPQALTGKLAGLYKLRVGDYRVVYEILRNERAIVVQSAGHRSDIYRRQ